MAKSKWSDGEVVEWTAGKQRGRVPSFVLEQTGAKNKAAIVAKYGQGHTFTKKAARKAA